ncbi:MAG: hypothetical protein WAM82_09110 [Thermoanaerobaculia bacterium]
MRIVGRIMLPLSLGFLFLSASTAYAASPSPCEIISAEAWGGIMGTPVTAIPGDMNCSYSGKSGGGQFRILATVGSSSEADASAKRMQDRQAKGRHNPGLSAIDSQGTVVFSVALFQSAPTADSASQLKKLVAAAKQHLAK